MESVVDESNISNESITSEPLKRRKKRNNLTAEERLAKITSLQYGAPTITKSAPEKPAEVKAVDTLPTEPAVSIAPHIPPEKFAKETLPEQAVLDDLLKNLTNEQLNFTNSDDTYMSRLTDSSFSKEEMKEFPNLESINFDNLFGGNKVQDQFLNKLGLLRRVLVVLLALVSLYNVPMFIVNTDVANTGYLLSYSPIFLQNILLRANRLASESVTTHELLSINGFDFTVWICFMLIHITTVTVQLIYKGSHKVEKDALSEIVDQMGLNKLKSFGLNLWGYYEIFSNVVSDNHRQCSTYKPFFSSSSNFNKDENIFFKTKQVNATKSISKEENEENIDKKARLLIKCVCNVCKNVITKSFSKLAYLKGVVIIECNGCKSKHLIADHLGWFDSQKKIGTIEDILKEKGEEVKTLKFTGSLDEAMEFINKEKKET